MAHQVVWHLQRQVQLPPALIRLHTQPWPNPSADSGDTEGVGRRTAERPRSATTGITATMRTGQYLGGFLLRRVRAASRLLCLWFGRSGSPGLCCRFLLQPLHLLTRLPLRLVLHFVLEPLLHDAQNKPQHNTMEQRVHPGQCHGSSRAAASIAGVESRGKEGLRGESRRRGGGGREGGGRERERERDGDGERGAAAHQSIVVDSPSFVSAIVYCRSNNSCRCGASCSSRSRMLLHWNCCWCRGWSPRGSGRRSSSSSSSSRQ